jgi:hypothetical protein
MRTRLALLALGTLSACSPNNDVTTPDDVATRFGDGEAGVYALQSVSGKSLPTEIITNESVRVIAIADTLFLFGNGKGTNVTVERVIDGSSTQGTVYRYESALTYTLDGSRLTVEFICNDVIALAACIAPPHLKGALDGTALNLDFAIAQRVPQRFTKAAGLSNVTSVQISPLDRLTVGVGKTLQLATTIRNAEGNVVTGRAVTWRTIIPGAATVSSAGTVYGVARGITLVSAFVDGRADTVSIHVEP